MYTNKAHKQIYNIQLPLAIKSIHVRMHSPDKKNQRSIHCDIKESNQRVLLASVLNKQNTVIKYLILIELI